MKSEKDTERLIKGLRHKARRDAHDRILGSLLATVKQRRQQPRAALPPKGLMGRPATKWSLAAAAIILALGLLLARRHPQEQTPGRIATAHAKAPIEMLTAVSLEAAFRRGGIEAVEEQSRKALETPASARTSPSVQQLLAELIGNGIDAGGKSI
jgi:hypothetical protein